MKQPDDPLATTHLGQATPLDSGLPTSSGSYCIVDRDGAVSFPCDEQLRLEVDHDFQVGSLIHERYLLIRCLGRGGMGQVLLAQDQLLHRPVAMKIVAVRLSEQRRAFQDALAIEARLGASLSDRGIAVVHDFGIHAGKCFIIFEFVDGRTLRDILNEYRSLPLNDVRRIISELARSLDFAHANGVVHRDLKPENICLARNGQPKILDFGIARNLRSDFREEVFSGTPQYASPEQSACSAIDGRTDQYALGLLAYEMLAGRKVFGTGDPAELLRLHREADPENLRKSCPELPDAAVFAVHRALAKQPSQRFATCQEFARSFCQDAELLPASRAIVAVPEQNRIDAYLCHVSDNSLDIRQLATVLEQHGYVCWYYQRDASSEVTFLRQTCEAMQRSRAVVLLISPAAVSSEDFGRQLTEAMQHDRVVLPLLLGFSIDEFEAVQPAWRPLLGSVSVMEIDPRNRSQGFSRVAESLATHGILPTGNRLAERPSAASAVPVSRSQGLQSQIWATDSSQIDVHDLPRVVFRNPLVDEFLNRRNKYFLSGTKGVGKTLLLSFKRHLLTQSRSPEESGLCCIPQGRPYLDFMSELRSLSLRYQTSLSDLSTAKRFWGMALRVSAISHHAGFIDPDAEDELQSFPARFRRWLKGSPVQPTVVFKELTNLSVSQANALVDDTETSLDQGLRSIHSSTFFFIDKVDQAVRQLGREAWIIIQAGLIEAAWEIMNANSHIRVYASIRQEAFANYQSDVKSNLMGAVTSLRYSDEELETLMDRLTNCYEASTGFKDFLGMRVLKHNRRSLPEDSFRFLRRHTFGRPRDLVVIASELSANRPSLSEPRYCELVRRTSATRLVATLFEEMRAFLDCLSDAETRARFLAVLPANILSRSDAIAVCATFNGISHEMVREFGEDASEIFHPFQDLYLAGLLGVVSQTPDTNLAMQKFRQPDDLVNPGGRDLPLAAWYFLHPALSSFVRDLQTGASFLHFEHVVVGDQLPWNPWDPVCCQIERLGRSLVAPDLRQFVDALIRLSREVLRSSTPRNLPLLLPTIPGWHESRARLLQQGHDELLLWIEELNHFAV